MIRTTAGQTIAESFSVAVDGDSYTAIVTDALGKRMSATATVNGSVVDLSVGASQWSNGRGGYGMIEIKKVLSGVTSFVVSERFRIMPGLEAEPGTLKDYA